MRDGRNGERICCSAVKERSAFDSIPSIGYRWHPPGGTYEDRPQYISSAFKLILRRTMKKSALVLLIVLWPVTAYSSLISYDISFTVWAANLLQPLYGNISVQTHLVQNTEGNPFNPFIQINNGLGYWGRALRVRPCLRPRVRVGVLCLR